MKQIRTILFLVILIPSFLLSQARHPVRAKNGMVVSAHKLASEVGNKILQEGGNAIDAAVATAFALAVVYPTAGNIGGGGFIIYAKNDGDVTTFDFREKAPLAATPNMFLDENGEYIEDSNHEGLLSVGVPGTVAGLELAHKKYGKMPWKKLVAPAIKLAEKGFNVTRELHLGLKYRKDIFLKYPSSQKAFMIDEEQVLPEDHLWIQSDLAETLKRIQEDGKKGFYEGKTAKLLADFMSKNGGLITLEDLKKYEAIERKPVKGNYRGFDVYSMPPPSSGGLTIIQMMQILENFDLNEMGHNSAEYIHTVSEAMSLAYLDRARFIGDPDFNDDIPMERLLSKDYAKQQSSKISFEKKIETDSTDVMQYAEGENTTHFSVVDKDGNAVSLTYTLEYGFGSKIVAEGGGYLLNNEMGDFNPKPGETTSTGMIGTKANLIAPEKRMLSSMTPTIIMLENKPFLVIGTPGGRTIINTVLQIALNVIDFRMNIAEAIDARRFHHQWMPDRIIMAERATTKDSEKILESLGHKIYPVGRIGNAAGIMIYMENDETIITGAADERGQDGSAEGH